MLDSNSHEQDLSEWIFSLPCSIVLPAKLREKFDKSGPAATIVDDSRSGMRIHCRGNNNRAALEIRQNYPAIRRPLQWQAVYLANISKKGCGLLHSHVLYPGELFTLVLLTGIRRTVEITWCRRLDKHCYEVAHRFADPIPALDTKE